MTVTWSDLVETEPEQPADAVTDRSSIDVVTYDRHVVAEADASGITLVRDTLTERFSGGIDGEGYAEHLRYLKPDGSNTFVGIERIAGTISGRRGSVSLTCHGTTDAAGVVRGVWHVVPDSGAGELRGIHGRGEFTAAQSGGQWQAEDVFTHWYEST